MNAFLNATIYSTMAIDNKIGEIPQFRLEIENFINKFISYDWGDLSQDDANANNTSIKTKDFILGSYKSSFGKIYIIADASSHKFYDTITILFANEY